MRNRVLATIAVLAMLLCMAVGCKKDEPKPAPTPVPQEDPYEGETELNAVKYGLDNTGKTDMTEKMTALHKEAAEKNKAVYYPNGTYLFNGKTLDFSGGVRFESLNGVLIRNGVSESPVINFDDFGNLIGLMQNHLEEKFVVGATEDATQNGNLLTPPLAKTDYQTRVDFLPYWFNEFGTATILKNSATWNGWYDWQWNHHDYKTNGSVKASYDPYDPTRHPLLGWYHGDDPVVLDWICYWLQEYGVRQAMLLGGFSDEMSSKNNANHWVYQLLQKTPNAKQMRFGFWVPSTSHSATMKQVESSWWKVFNGFYFHEDYKEMVYTVEKNKKQYPCIFVWDEKAVATGIGGEEKLTELYKKVAEAFVEKGYGGVCVMANNALFAGMEQQATLEKLHVLWYRAGYADGGGVIERKTYTERVDSFIPYADTTFMYGVATGHQSKAPHPSGWTETGYNAADFGRWIKAVVEATEKKEGAVKTVTCYNVSEWAEGGPGLVPTVADRFEYLEAIRDNIVVKK